MGLPLEVSREDNSQLFVGLYDVDISLINRQRELLTCVCGKVAKRKNNGLGGKDTASPGLGPSRCIRYACLETVQFLRNDASVCCTGKTKGNIHCKIITCRVFS